MRNRSRSGRKSIADDQILRFAQNDIIARNEIHVRNDISAQKEIHAQNDVKA